MVDLAHPPGAEAAAQLPLVVEEVARSVAALQPDALEPGSVGRLGVRGAGRCLEADQGDRGGADRHVFT